MTKKLQIGKVKQFILLIITKLKSNFHMIIFNKLKLPDLWFFSTHIFILLLISLTL